MRPADRMVTDTPPTPHRRPTPAPSRGVTISVHDERDVVVTTRGPLDDAATGRIARLLAAVEADGARHVIVDVTASPDVPPGARRMLDELRARLARRGGWLLVEGAAAAPQEPTLLEVFAAYTAAVGDRVAPEIPGPRTEAALVG